MDALTTLGFRQRDAEAELASLAKREAEDKLNEDDIDILADALRKTGKTESDYREMVAFYQRALDLEEKAGKLPAAEKALAQAHNALAAHQRETEALLEKRKSALSALRKKHAEHETAWKALNAARCELEAMKVENPLLFALEPFDLDRYTLTSGAGANVLPHADPAAPTLEVPIAVWTREARRRGAIQQAATKRAFAEHNAKAGAWYQRQPKDYLGHLVGNETFPAFNPPGWGEIVDRRWNAELDESVA